MKFIFSTNFFMGLIYLLSGIICVLIFYIWRLYQQIFFLNQTTKYLQKDLKELDHQAKLIIKNDMELKLYQDAVNDKLKKLSFLKNFVNLSLNILDRDNLLQQIDKRTNQSLGFEKSCFILLPSMEVKVNLNFSEHELEALKDFIKNNQILLKALPLISSNLEAAKELKESLSSETFLLGPIITGANVQIVLCVCDCIMEEGITNAEKEVFSIICMYLGQCLDNIISFEALYHIREELQDKVKEKTFELTKTLEEKEKISKAKSNFISSVSHELRTPLTSIKGFSSLLVAEKFGRLPPQARERLKKIDDNVNKLVAMVNTLLDISRIESRKIEVNIATYDLNKLIYDTTDFLMPQIQEKDIVLTVDISPSFYVYMDKNLIERVLINLINNAIKFTPQKGKIAVKCMRGDSKAIVSVKDTGYGIPKDDLERIFEEFYRVNQPMHREVKGTGLGLSLVKRIIDIHKERIWGESELYKGTTFYFSLKVAKDV